MNETNQSPAAPVSTKWSVARVSQTLVGAFFGIYVGLNNFLVPVLGIWAAYAAYKKLSRPEDRPFLWSVSIQAGHGLWLGLGLALLGHFDLNDIDLVVIVAGLIWMITKPGTWPVALLSVYQVVGLLVNLFLIANVEFGSATSRALTMHIILRLLALGAMLIEYKIFRKHRVHTVPEIAPTTT